MKTGRNERLAEEIRKEVSQIVQYELSDPRIEDVQVTHVKMTGDLGLARVYFVMPNFPEKKKEVLKALKNAAGHVKFEIAQTLQLKFAPQIDFVYDETLEIQKNMDELFAKIKS